MTYPQSQPCPCQSAKSYGDCCAPLHSAAQLPASAEALMRSRYCAFVLKNIPYIVQSTVPSQQALLPVEELQHWANETQWQGLQIKQTESLSKIHALVEFDAAFAGENGETQHHLERSIFVNIAGRWYFVDPTVPLPTMKQPCVCGSGKKFKHCCGGYL